MYNTEDNKQNAILASVNTGSFDAEDSLQELEELADTAGARVVAQVIQNMPAVNSATYLGAGKLAQMAVYDHQEAIRFMAVKHLIERLMLSDCEI